MSDAVVTPKKQPGLDRLRRRLEHYRKQQQGRLLKYGGSLPSLYELQMQETLLLKQRHLDSKAKKSAKKSCAADKKTQEPAANNTTGSGAGALPPAPPPSHPNATHLQPRYGKRSLDEDVHGDEDAPASKVHCTTTSSTSGPGSTKFSVEIVQQLEFTASGGTTSQPQQISTSVSVKTLTSSTVGGGGVSSCVHQDVSASSSSPAPTINTTTKTTSSSSSNSGACQVQAPPPVHSPMKQECKTERIEPSFMEDLADVDDLADGLTGDLDNFRNIMGEVNEDFVDDIMKQINSNSEIAHLPPEFMKELELEEKRESDLLLHNTGMNLASLQQQQRNDLSNNSLNSGGGQGPNQFPFGAPTELSPAALTLKQMAEQHQHKNQLNIGPLPMNSMVAPVGPNVGGGGVGGHPGLNPSSRNDMPGPGPGPGPSLGGMNPAMRMPYGYSNPTGNAPAFNRGNAYMANMKANACAMYGGPGVGGPSPYHTSGANHHVPMTMQNIGGPASANNSSNNNESSLRSPLVKKENMFAQSPLSNIPSVAVSPSDLKRQHSLSAMQQLPGSGTTNNNPNSNNNIIHAKFSPGNNSSGPGIAGAGSVNAVNNNPMNSIVPGQQSPMNMQPPKTPTPNSAYLGGGNKPGTPNHMAMGGNFHSGPEAPTPPAQSHSPMVSVMGQQQKQVSVNAGPNGAMQMTQTQQMHVAQHSGNVSVQQTQMTSMQQTQMPDMKMNQQQLPMYYSNMPNNAVGNAGVLQQQSLAMNSAQNNPLPNQTNHMVHSAMMNNAQTTQQPMMNNPDNCYTFHASQTQTINFTQQHLRGNSVVPGGSARMPNMTVMQQQQQQQHMMRLQMLRSQQQQQQQQQQAMLRPPPPEYKPQLMPQNIGHVPQIRGIRPHRPEMNFAPSPGVNNGAPLAYPMNPLQQQQQQAGPMNRHPMLQSNPGAPNMQYTSASHGGATSNMLGNMNPAMLSLNRPPSNLSTGYAGVNNMRGQRPPNVTVGPDGMNVMASGPRPTDWRTQQQQLSNYQNSGRMNIVGNSMQPQQQQQLYPNARLNYHVQQQQTNVQSMGNGTVSLSMTQQQHHAIGMTGNANNGYPNYSTNNSSNSNSRNPMTMATNPRHGGVAMSADYGGFEFLDNIPTGESAQFCGDAQELLNNFDPSMGYSLLDSL